MVSARTQDLHRPHNPTRDNFFSSETMASDGLGDIQTPVSTEDICIHKDICIHRGHLYTQGTSVYTGLALKLKLCSFFNKILIL